MIRTNNYWLNIVMEGSKQHPQQIEWSRAILKDYEAITLENVSSVAKKYLDNKRAATIKIKPGK